MKRITLLFCFVGILAACNNNTETTTSADSSIVSVDTLNSGNHLQVGDSLLSGCYSYISNRDTASLQMQVTGKQVTGSLSYNLFEKDRNDGTFEGELNGDIISGWYLFRSEGQMSVRQVAWKVQQGSLLPAIGDVMQKHDSTVFKNLSSVSYDNRQAFTKVKCII